MAVLAIGTGSCSAVYHLQERRRRGGVLEHMERMMNMQTREATVLNTVLVYKTVTREPREM